MKKRIAKIVAFVDDRTGVKKLLHHALDEQVVGGTSWAYVFGSALSVIVMVQIVTGLMLMATYTPSTTGAWSSVFYIQERVTLGWFVRGLHHHGANAMMIVLGLHMLQVVVWGAYKKPREITWWFGLGLMGLAQAMALTGYLLPWDQKGYWATKVATNIAGSIPVVGELQQTLIVGGSDYGQSTLTRFYALHVGVLPLLLIGMVALHIALFRKNGATPSDRADEKKIGRFFPDQLFKDVVFSMVVLGVMAGLTVATGGAGLDAPADPSSDYPPRPDWYFLFLFQVLKYLPGAWELIGSVVLPALAGGFLFALPFLDRGESRLARRRLPWVGSVVLGFAAIVALTWVAVDADANDEEFQASRAVADRHAARARQLAREGIPPAGPVEMLRNDPMTQGRAVYEQLCIDCHALNGQGGEEDEHRGPVHTGFGSRAWIGMLLLDSESEHFFGGAGLDEEMPSQRSLGQDTLSDITEMMFSLGREPQDPDDVDAAAVARAEEPFRRRCLRCHVYRGDGDFMGTGGPNLTGWGSRTWILRQVSHPDAPTQYGELNQMPAFHDQLDERDLRMVTAYLRLQRFEQPDFTVDAEGDDE